MLNGFQNAIENLYYLLVQESRMSALSDAQVFVDKLKVAYSQCLEGKLKQVVRIGGTDFYQQVTYIQPTAEEIFAQLKYWQGIVTELTAQTTATQSTRFSENNTISLVVRN